MAGQEQAVQHKPSIVEEDIHRLEAYFADVLDSTDPVKLTQYCWFYVTLHFALRGAEVQIKLKKTDLVFCSSDGTEEYITLATDFMSKNCPGGVKGRNSTHAEGLQTSVKSLLFGNLSARALP